MQNQKHIFLDTNVFNRCISKDGQTNINGKQLKDLLLNAGFQPVVGIHTTYELAKTYQNNQPRFKGFFTLLQDLEPYYTRSRKIIYSEEILKLRNERHTIKNIEENAETLAKLNARFSQYSLGKMSDSQATFIKLKTQAVKEQVQHWTPNKGKQKEYKKYSSFEERVTAVKENWGNHTDAPSLTEWIKLLKKMSGIVVSKIEALELVNNPGKYPSINSVFRQQAYLDFNAESNQNNPSYGRLTDGIQLIEASYCGSFLIAGDKSLQMFHGPCVSPDIKFITFDSIIKDTIPCNPE